MQRRRLGEGGDSSIYLSISAKICDPCPWLSPTQKQPFSINMQIQRRVQEEEGTPPAQSIEPSHCKHLFSNSLIFMWCLMYSNATVAAVEKSWVIAKRTCSHWITPPGYLRVLFLHLILFQLFYKVLLMDALKSASSLVIRLTLKIDLFR